MKPNKINVLLIYFLKIYINNYQIFPIYVSFLVPLREMLFCNV